MQRQQIPVPRPPIRKAFAYITSGTRVLLFTHPDHPEAGIQVPAGTIERGESPADAALREAREETNLADLTPGRWLGRDVFDAHAIGRHELHDRWFWHITAGDDVPETWRHGEMFGSNGSREHIAFDFFWADLREPLPPLIADHDRFIPELKAVLGIE
ncbi:MAG TPA: NUDIX domain-containing protein [Thermomicrobiales bacterium]|nr:NUDIX domain-containing protein [Thermomicrobiales bacterium]